MEKKSGNRGDNKRPKKTRNPQGGDSERPRSTIREERSGEKVRKPDQLGKKKNKRGNRAYSKWGSYGAAQGNVYEIQENNPRRERKENGKKKMRKWEKAKCCPARTNMGERSSQKKHKGPPARKKNKKESREAVVEASQRGLMSPLEYRKSEGGKLPENP